MTGKAFGIALIAAFMLLAANGLAKAASAGEINASVNATLDRFYRQIPGARELSARATGVLVFPTVLKAGFGVGGEYGEGAMRVGGRRSDTTSRSRRRSASSSGRRRGPSSSCS
jgi:lipid-binding SYLF domain-containing protein